MGGRSSSGPSGRLLTPPGPVAAASSLAGRSHRARGSREGRCWFSDQAPALCCRAAGCGRGTTEQAGEMLTASMRLRFSPQRRLCCVCCIFKRTLPFCFFPLPTKEARWRAWRRVWSLDPGAGGSPGRGEAGLVRAGRRAYGGAAAALAAQRLNLPPIGSALCRLPCPRPKQSRCLFSQPLARSGRHVT